MSPNPATAERKIVITFADADGVVIETVTKLVPASGNDQHDARNAAKEIGRGVLAGRGLVDDSDPA